MLEASESNLYTLERDWAASRLGFHDPFSAARPMRRCSMRSLQRIRPRIVFHAAAFKHVPLMEEHPLAAIANNIFATEISDPGGRAHGARVVLLSTDKAVEPASVMGATKRVAEQIVLAAGGTVLRLGMCWRRATVWRRSLRARSRMAARSPSLIRGAALLSSPR